MRIIKNGPADNAGIRENERLSHLNATKVVPWTHAKVCEMIRAANTTITMMVKSGF